MHDGKLCTRIAEINAHTMHDEKLNNSWWEVMHRQWITEINAQTMHDGKYQ